ncbi:DUF309 domain-containing protein [Chelatococcus reniformis]|uniref:DUF309 domain-containing protein n=1 Tax=Chelatococcus reniformis TaxID=1494448 RepID=A0A916TY37_9HYPH|nr:DUF309 domain-containing protein [Chelatococcus reniformis]GGC49238.1 hypothetical protein GCM10010994_05510 [Chelatococcus reniformis]
MCCPAPPEPGERPDAWPLPRWAHLPGRTAGPDREPLERAKRALPARFAAFVPADDAGLRYGLSLHDAGFFWEAHEVWEAVWKAAPMNGRDRLALRAAIQIANGGLKRRLGRPRAVRRLVAEAMALLDELRLREPGAAPASYADRLDAASLCRALAACGAGCALAADAPLVHLDAFQKHA